MLVRDLIFKIRPFFMNMGSLTGHQGARKWVQIDQKWNFFLFFFSTLQTEVSSAMTNNEVKS